MALTLAQIDAATFTALSAGQHSGTPSAAAPFALVGRFAGEVDDKTIDEAAAQWPCAFLRFDGESDTSSVQVVDGSQEIASEAAWTVLVGVEDPRSIDAAISGASGVPGALTLVDRVQALCNGLILSDSLRYRRLRCTGVTPALIRRGIVYVYAVRFVALRALPEVAPTNEEPVLTAVVGNVNLEGTADDAPNPLVMFDALA